uniref:Uncharacterized protein n=1 Tax=uncultured gamma proteobacterium HF0500_05P21 TaxID=723572 RepID=E7C4R8_9GAMM|nr:hypothetical protein [uncultured gamma proteobacterium HF0500_05P21]
MNSLSIRTTVELWEGLLEGLYPLVSPETDSTEKTSTVGAKDFFFLFIPQVCV